MPRAYSPNLRTVQRAGRVTAALGITGWHLASGPDVWWREDDRYVRVALRELAQRVTLYDGYAYRHADRYRNATAVRECVGPLPIADDECARCGWPVERIDA